MPADRLIHKRCGKSRKCTALSDLEFRVWMQYELSSDDYGVMRLSAITLQADNDALAQRPTRTIQRCFERLVDVGLLVAFGHQGCRYVCQRDWQDFQKVKHPRDTIEPIPPPDVLDACTARTRELFQNHSGSSSEVIPHDFEKDYEDVRSLARAGTRETANGKRLTANGSEGEECEKGAGPEFDAFWMAYPRKVGKGAARREWGRVRPDTALVARILAAVELQRGSSQWTRDGGQFIPHPRTWLSQQRWEDEPDQPRGPTVTKRTQAIIDASRAFLEETPHDDRRQTALPASLQPARSGHARDA